MLKAGVEHPPRCQKAHHYGGKYLIPQALGLGFGRKLAFMTLIQESMTAQAEMIKKVC